MSRVGELKVSHGKEGQVWRTVGPCGGDAQWDPLLCGDGSVGGPRSSSDRCPGNEGGAPKAMFHSPFPVPRHQGPEVPQGSESSALW